jgi:molybdopterin synthase sulfur carrier subunit
MSYSVLYFASYREALGIDREQVEGEFASVDALREFLILRGDRDVLKAQNLMCARNDDLCSLDEALLDGDEIAFFPPVTGG